MSNGQEREQVAPDVDVLARLAKAFRGGMPPSSGPSTGGTSGSPSSPGEGNGDRRTPPERPPTPPSPPARPSPPPSTSGSSTSGSSTSGPSAAPPPPAPPAPTSRSASPAKPAPPAPAPAPPPRTTGAAARSAPPPGAGAAPAAPPRRTGLAPITTPLAEAGGRRPAAHPAERPAHAARRAPTPFTPPRLLVASAAAVVAALVGVVAVLAVRGSDGSAATVLARAELQPLVDAEPVEARLVDTVDGLMLELDLEEADLPASPGYREVWLASEGITGITGLASLGPARPDGTYVVPAGIDYHDFPVVDVSVESPDGNPVHSGITVLRGTLE